MPQTDLIGRQSEQDELYRVFDSAINGKGQSGRHGAIGRTVIGQDEAMMLLEIAAVAGLHFDLELVISLAGGDSGLDELVNHSLIFETQSGYHSHLSR